MQKLTSLQKTFARRTHLIILLLGLAVLNLINIDAVAQTKIFQVDTGGTLTTGLVSYYKLEDATDFWGTNNLTNNNSTPFDAGKVSNAADFNGTTQFLSLAMPVSTATNAISAAGWVYLSGTSLDGAFLKNGKADSNPNSDGWGIGIGNSTYQGTGNNLTVVSATINWMSVNNIGTGWHHVAFTKNGTSWILYVDGVAMGSFSNSITTPSTRFEMGRGADNGGPLYYFPGKLDEWGVWNKTLSPAEISELYNGGVGQTMVLSNPVPTTTNISPASKTAADAGFTLTVNGTNFVANSVVNFNGSPRTTTYVSATQLTASILASDLTATGTFPITVFNPSPGGGTSGAQTLTVNAGATATVDWNNSNVQEITLAASRSFTFTNGQSGGVYTLLVGQNATGGSGITWPANVKWSGGTAPTLTATPNAVDMIKFVYTGTNYMDAGI